MESYPNHKRAFSVLESSLLFFGTLIVKSALYVLEFSFLFLFLGTPTMNESPVRALGLRRDESNSHIEEDFHPSIEAVVSDFQPEFVELIFGNTLLDR